MKAVTLTLACVALLLAVPSSAINHGKLYSLRLRSHPESLLETATMATKCSADQACCKVAAAKYACMSVCNDRDKSKSPDKDCPADKPDTSAPKPKQTTAPKQSKAVQSSVSSTGTPHEVEFYSAGTAGEAENYECRNYGDLTGVWRFLMVQKHVDVDKCATEASKQFVITRYKFQIKDFGPYKRFEQTAGDVKNRIGCKGAKDAAVGKQIDEKAGTWYSIPSTEFEASSDEELASNSKKLYRFLGSDRVVLNSEFCAKLVKAGIKTVTALKEDKLQSMFESLPNQKK